MSSYKRLTIVLKLTELKLDLLCKIKKFHFRRYYMYIVYVNTCTLCVHLFLPINSRFWFMIINKYFADFLRFLHTLKLLLHISLLVNCLILCWNGAIQNQKYFIKFLNFVTPIPYLCMLALWFCRWPLCIQTMTQSLSLVDFMAVYKQEWYPCQWKSPHLEE